MARSTAKRRPKQQLQRRAAALWEQDITDPLMRGILAHVLGKGAAPTSRTLISAAEQLRLTRAEVYAALARLEKNPHARLRPRRSRREFVEGTGRQEQTFMAGIPAGYITLGQAEAKYGVPSRVIQRMIAAQRVATYHQRGGPLYVDDVALQALSGAGELVDIAAGAAAASSGRKKGS